MGGRLANAVVCIHIVLCVFRDGRRVVIHRLLVSLLKEERTSPMNTGGGVIGSYAVSLPIAATRIWQTWPRMQSLPLIILTRHE